MGYETQAIEAIQAMGEKSAKMKAICVAPIIGEDDGKIIQNDKTRNERIKHAVAKTELSQMKGGGMVGGAFANSVIEYVRIHGELPPEDLFASAYDGLMAAIAYSTGGKIDTSVGVFESADLSTTEGIIFQEKLVAMMLPTMLKGITNRFISHIPGDANESAIYKFKRIAKTAFGEYAAGDEITLGHQGPYGVLTQRKTAGTGNGSLTTFTHTPSPATPVKPHSIKVMHDFVPVAADDGNGNLTGVFYVGATKVTITGSVNYATGVIAPTFSVAPVSGVKIDVGFDLDIEKNPALIPQIAMDVEKRTVRPHESALGAGVTLQALWMTRREYKMDQSSRLAMQLRNLLASDRDRQRLAAMYYFAQGQASFAWDSSNSGFGVGEFYYSGLNKKLQEVSSSMLAATEVSGLKALVCDTATAAKLKAFPKDYFTPAPGYMHEPQPHFIGKLFGIFDVYENPSSVANLILCIGKGPGMCEAPFIAGDAIPPIALKHPMTTGLLDQQTLWSVAYDDLNPFNGASYLRRIVVS